MQLSKDNTEMQDYISALINQIPTSTERFCENNFVNAIISHYASLCNINNIEFTHNIIVPEIIDQSKNIRISMRLERLGRTSFLMN